MFKVLIVGASWLGDMVMSQSLFKILKAQNKIIHVLAPKWNHEVLNCMPEIDLAIEMPFDHGQAKFYQRYKFAKLLRQERYNEAIVLPNSFKSALIPYWANIPIRTGWLGEFRYGVLNNYQKLDKNALPLMIQRLTALAYFNQGKNFDQNIFAKQDIPNPQLKTNPSFVTSVFDRFSIDTTSNISNKILILAPGAAFGEAKKWPEEYFAKVAVDKTQSGWDVVLLGSVKDRISTDYIEKKVNNPKKCKNLAGQLQLPETVAIISKATVIVSNDSGLLHVAASLNIPLIGIYGSTSPNFTPPLIEDKKKIILSIDKSELPCRPCFEKTCRYGHLKCLRDIEPQQVIESVDKLCEY